MTRNPVGLALIPSEYDKEFVVESINRFFPNLQLIDNVKMNTLAIQTRAPNRIIEERAENIRNATDQLKSKVHFKHSKHVAWGHSIQKEKFHLINFDLQNQRTKSLLEQSSKNCYQRRKKLWKHQTTQRD